MLIFELFFKATKRLQTYKYYGAKFQGSSKRVNRKKYFFVSEWLHSRASNCMYQQEIDDKPNEVFLHPVQNWFMDYIVRICCNEQNYVMV